MFVIDGGAENEDGWDWEEWKSGIGGDVLAET